MPAAFAFWLGAALLLPQDVPTVSLLGPRPAAAVALAVPLPAELPQPLADDVLLTVPAALPWGDVDLALRRLATHGAKLVHFAAALPDGTPGAVVLALTEAPDVPVSLVLRAHRQRSGVPVDSVRVVLSRLLADLEPERAGSVPLALEVPADARCEQALRLLVACVDGGAKRLVLRAGPAAGRADERSALALDLDGALRLHVAPQSAPAARPTLQAEPFGIVLPPPLVAPEPDIGGGAGGRYAGRGAGNRRVHVAAAAVERSLAWLERQVGVDGACRAGGASTVEATALVALAFLGDGNNLVQGQHHDGLQRTIGFLLASQRADGTFGDGPDATPRAQALACFALAEAYGLSSGLHARLLRGPLVDGMQQLWHLRHEDGGFGAGERSDVCTTAEVAMAMASAGFFKVPAPAAPVELSVWLGENAPGSGSAVAAAEFARCLLGTANVPAAAAPAWLQDFDVADAEGCYWLAHALFQAGGKPFQEWVARCESDLIAKQVEKGADAGTFVIAPRAGSVGATPQLVATARWTMALQVRRRYARMLR